MVVATEAAMKEAMSFEVSVVVVVEVMVIKMGVRLNVCITYSRDRLQHNKM